MKSIDVKSLIIGFLSCALIIACTGATVNFKPKESQIGRYGLACMAGNMWGRCFVIDTLTGLVLGDLKSEDAETNLELIHPRVRD